MNAISSLSAEQLMRMAKIKMEIAKLEKQLEAMFGTSTPTPIEKPAKKRKVSVAAKAKMRAAQKARWDKIRAEKGGTLAVSKPVEKPAKKRRKLSIAEKAARRQFMKEWWAKKKATEKAGK